MNKTQVRSSRKIRWFAAFCLVAFAAGSAAAQPPWKRRGRKKKVYIDSAPQQAAVYIENKTHGIACYTPCKIRLPYKQTFPVWLVKQGFQTHTGQVTAARRSRDRKFYFVMKRAIQKGTLDIRSGPGGSAVGASLYVNGVPMGTVPSQAS